MTSTRNTLLRPDPPEPGTDTPTELQACDRPDSLDFTLCRVPDGTGAQLQWLLVALTAQGALLAAMQALGPLRPGWLSALFAGECLAFAVVIWQYVALLRLRRNTPARLCLDATGVRVRGSRGETLLTVGYDRILSLEPQTGSGRRRWRGLLLFFTRHGPLQLREGLFESDAAALDFDEALHRRIALLPNAAQRLHRMQRRRDAAAFVWRRVPSLCVAIVAVLGSIWALRAALPAAARLQSITLLASSEESLSSGAIAGLLGAAMLHADASHLAGCSIALLVLGGLLEHLLGRQRLALLLGLSSIAGFLASSLWSPPSYSIGASGGVMGGLGALATLNLLRRDELPGRLRFSKLALGCLFVLGIANELWAPNVDHVAHGVGFATGAAICAWMLRGRPLLRLAERPPTPVAGLAWALGAAYSLAVGRILYTAARLW